LPGYSVDGLRVGEVYRVTKEAVERARGGGGPTLIEVRVNRMTPHSSDDDDRTYRTREEMEAMKEHDPLDDYRQSLLDQGVIDEARVEALDQKAKEAVDDAVKFAEEASYPDVEEATYPVYAEDVRDE
jgi:2-oxoisovalerate dehydrogenase E1 component alpha subunit